AGQRPPAPGRLPPVEHGLRADVGLQAAAGAAPAGPAVEDDAGVPPLAGAAGDAAGDGPVADHRGTDARADQGDHRVLHTAAGAEPQLGLTERLRPVLQV